MAETKSNNQILQELEALSQSLYQSQGLSTARRTTSLALPRTAFPPNENAADKDEMNFNPKQPRSRRMSLSPWRSRPKPDANHQENDQKEYTEASSQKNKWADSEPYSEKKGIWNWKPIRALSHIGMQKLSCLFSIEVVTVQGLPASMNGLRLAVCVRKKETKDGVVQTMPSRVSQGNADFEETLFIRCHVYFSPGTGTHMKFEARPFLIYVVAVDADELYFGRNSVDLSGLIQESISKSFEGTRIRQWETTFSLLGKAKGGELVLKLGFQIMEKDGGIGIYSQTVGQKSAKSRNYSPSFGRRQSKSSFSVPSPRISSRAEAWTPSQRAAISSDLQGIDDLNLDELQTKMDDSDVLPEFNVVDKGVEIRDKDGEKQEEKSKENSDKRSVSSEVVKEVVQDQSHLRRLSELDSIALQIKALESMMMKEKTFIKTDEETASQILDAEEDKVTREFLLMLEDAEGDNKLKSTNDRIPQLKLGKDEDAEEVFVPDLGKALGCVVQTRNGGFLAAMNPLEAKVARKDTPKLAIQMSKPVIIQSEKNGFELFQKMAAIGVDELTSEIISLMPMDELMGKTAEKIAFEGIASAIIQGRNKEGASSTAARTMVAIKNMVTAMNTGRKERFSTGIWSVNEDLLTVDEILAFSMQKIETMALDALKIQADIAEEEAPFDVSPLLDANKNNNLLASAVPIEDWTKQNNIKTSADDDFLDSESIIISVLVQLRDPMRQYEAVGGPMLAMIHAALVTDHSYDEEKRYKVGSLQVAGIKVRTSGTKNLWDSEKQKLAALQWLVAYGMGKAGKRGKRFVTEGPDLLWSISSRVLADMWLKPMRNPDVKFTK